MTASELRIGNYVFDNLGGILKIKVVSEDSYLIHIKPIPLSEEWLLKFGFENCINGWWSRNELLNVKLKEDGTEIYLHGSDTNLANYPIDYVHQLQNLYFALTGLEL